jgi:hypothetical protein
LAQPTLGQVVTAPKGTGLVIDNVLQVRPAKVIMNMDHDAFSPIFDSWVFRAHAKLLNSLVVASVLAKLVVPRVDAVRH